jgi:threonylcarbamoyladenosine tRNA methylthiotransferase MtaB
MAELFDEATSLLRSGHKEIILTGVNAALYNDGGRDIGSLTESIAALPGDFRLRLSSLEPTVIDADYAKRITRIEKLCPHLHLSLQSGSDATLAAMGRRYTMEDYAKIVRILKERDPLFGLTTDIIVGFPGETESDFERSVDAVNETGFSHVHVFRYSKRPGTRAAEMPNQIPEYIKKERAGRLIEAAGGAAEEYRAKCRGAVRRALVLGPAGGASADVISERSSSRRMVGSRLMRVLTDIGVEAFVPDGAGSVNEFIDVRL